MLHIRFCSIVLVSTVGLASCAGKGEPLDYGKGDVAVCRATGEDVELDEVTPTGFSAQQVLALAEGTHTAPGYLIEANALSGNFKYGPDESHEVSVEVSYAGHARYIAFDHTDRSEGTYVGTERPDSFRPASTDATYRCFREAGEGGLEVDVTVHVSALDYGVDETFPAVLYGSPEWAQLDGPSAARLDIGQLFFSRYGTAGLAQLGQGRGVQWPVRSEACLGRWPLSETDGSPSVSDVMHHLEQAPPVGFGKKTDARGLVTEPEYQGSVAFSDAGNICGAPNIDGDMTLIFDAMMTLDQDGDTTTVPVRVWGSVERGGSYDDERIFASAFYQCSSIGADSLPVCGDLGVEQGAFDELRQTIAVAVNENPFGEVGVQSEGIRIEGMTSDCSLAPEPEFCPEERPFAVVLDYTAFNSPNCCPL